MSLETATTERNGIQLTKRPLHNGNDDDTALAINNNIVTHEDDNELLLLSHPHEQQSPTTTRFASPILYCRILVFGQCLSFLLAVSGASQASLHLVCSLSAPTFSSGIMYLLLVLIHVIPLYRKGQRIQQQRMRNHNDDYRQQQQQQEESRNYYWLCHRTIPVRVSPWIYLGIAFLDVEANYLTVLAFRYTTLTSVTLFDALAVPSAMIFSYFCLRRSYTRIHFVGVMVCLCGVLFNVLADSVSDRDNNNNNKEASYPHKVRGDVLAILGGICYGLNDVLAETSVRNFGGPIEFLGVMGFFAFLISIVQASILERDDIVKLFQDDEEGDCTRLKRLGLLGAYAGSAAVSYVGASRFLLLSEATFLNLSFLTGDLWSVGFSIVGERIVPSPLFWVALSMTVSGVCIYEMGPSPVVVVVDKQDGPAYIPTSTDEKVEETRNGG